MESCVIIRFIAAPGFVGSAIRWTTNSLFQHVEFGTGTSWIGAHAGDGVQEHPLDYCAPTREYVYNVPCSAAQRDLMMVYARAMIGKKYNYLDIVGLLFRRRKLTSPGRVICSQFVTDGLLQVFGAKKVLNVRTDYSYLITPQELHLSPLFVGNLVKKVE